MARARVLIVESGLGHGGSAICLANALRHLDRQTFDPVVVFYSDGQRLAWVEDLEIPVLRVLPRDSRRMRVLERPAEERVRWRSYGLMAWHLAGEVLPRVPTFVRLCREQGAELVHLNSGIIGSLAALVGARLAGVPVVCHHRLSRRLTVLERLAARWIDAFIPVSLAAAEGLWASSIPEGRMHVIYDGLEADRFAAAREARERVRAGLGVPAGARLVGTVARLARVKGQKELLEAGARVLRDVPDAHFVLVGDAAPEEREYEAALRRFVMEGALRGRVTFAGYRGDVPEVTAALDVAVQPSLYCEGQGMAAVEAMMAGLPLVVTESGALPETVGHDGAGIIVPPGDAERLAGAVVSLLRDPARAAAMGEAARRRAQQVFGLDATVAELERVYRRALDSAGRRQMAGAAPEAQSGEGRPRRNAPPQVEQGGLPAGPGLWRLRMGGTRRPGLYILFYHRVNAVADPLADAMPLAAFEAQMAFLARNFRVESLEGILTKGLTAWQEPVVALTFDDGHRDFLTAAYPILRRYRLPATLFVVTDCVGDADFLWTDKLEHAFRLAAVDELELTCPAPLRLRLRTLEERASALRRVKAALKVRPDAECRAVVADLTERLGLHGYAALKGAMLTWEEIRGLAADGIGIGSHSRSHPILTQIAPGRVAEEVVGSRAIIEAMVGRPPSVFCYPNGDVGDFDDALKTAVRAAGYRGAVTSVFGVNNGQADPFALRRMYFARRVLGSMPVRAAAALQQALGEGTAS